MQQASSTVPQPEPENRYPDCLNMKMQGVPVQPEEKLQLLSSIFNPKPIPPRTEQINLLLTIRFGQREEQLFGGSVTFGIKRGDLKLKLENGKVPLELLALTDKFEPVIEKTTEIRESIEEQGGAEIALGGGKVTASAKGTKGVAQTAKYKDYQVRTRGSEEAPVWVFEVKTGQPVLSGLLTNEKLGTLNVKAKPCRVEATFEVSKRDVYLTDAKGLYPPNVSRNKLAVIERMIALHLLESKLKPYLSRAELRYD